MMHGNTKLKFSGVEDVDWAEWSIVAGSYKWGY
jgi:hypothetical protein